MKLRLIFIGRLGQGEADRLTAGYLLRIRKFCPLEVVEVRPATGRALRGADRSERETRAALAALGERDLAAVLDSSGVQMTSRDFARWLDRALRQAPAVAFVIGGAEGLSASLRKRAHTVLSLSSLTLPHELARAVLTEQIYRGLSILRGTPYPR